MVQFNLTKEMLVADIAEYFQREGFTVLTYDPRSIGDSDGLPRNEIDPSRNAEDYHDALTFLQSHPLVDPERIAFWGFSFSAMVTLTAAALDKRAKAVIAMCPPTSFEYPQEKWPHVLSKAMKDRESQLSGNKPCYIPMILDTGESPTGYYSGIGKDGFKLFAEAKTFVPNFELPTTLKSYYHIAAWKPLELMRFVSPTPVLVVTPENDLVSPAEMQKSLIFDQFQEPKRLHVVPGKGHMNVLSGEDFSRVLDVQVNFLRGVLGPVSDM